ncbi:MAG: hypothetical protein DME23_21025, partial [Verrucomicrobia bacterium]
MKASFRLTCSPARLFTLFALCAALWLPARAAVPEPFELQDGDRVLFIGDTFFEREVDYGHIETRLTAAFPDRNITFRNLAWAADAPMGRSRASFDWNKPEEEWLRRVKEQVALVKPTVAFLSYGMTAALEQSSAGVSPARQTAALEKFNADMKKLMDAIEEVSGSTPDRPKKVRFVLLGPNRGDPTKAGESLLRSLKAYDAAIKEVAASRHAYFVSLLTFQGSNKAAADFDPDGIHLSEPGYIGVAGEIPIQLGTGPGPSDQKLTRYEALRSAIRKKNELFFHRWRPENWTYLFGFRKQEQGQNAVEIPKFDPLIAEWEARIAKLR